MNMVSPRYSEIERNLGIPEVIPWYWNILLHSSPWLLMAGFVLIPAAMDDRRVHIHADRSVIIVISFIVIGLAYIFCALSGYRWRRSHVLQERILIPFFGSSLIGMLNAVTNITFRRLYPLGVLSIAVISISVASAVGYGIAVVYNSKMKTVIPGLLKKGRNFRDSGLDDEELQRRQLLRLYLKKDSDRAPSVELSQSTFRIDLPEARDEELIGTPSQPAYERQPSPAAHSHNYNPFVMRDVSPGPAPSGNQGGNNNLSPSNIPKSWHSPRQGQGPRRPLAELGDL